MESNQSNQPSLIKVLFPNMMHFQFPYDENSINLAAFFPKWSSSIQAQEEIMISNIDDYLGTIEFFQGIINNNLKVSSSNLKTIFKLCDQSGYCQSEKNVISAIFHNDIESLLTCYINSQFFVEENCEIERLLSENYEELFMYPKLLMQVDITKHHRLLSNAKKQPFSQTFLSNFVNFMIEAIKINPSIQILFSCFNINEFPIETLKRLSITPNFDDRFFIYDQNLFINLYINNSDKQNSSMNILSSQNQKEITSHEQIFNQIKQFDHYKTNQFDGILKYAKSKIKITSGALEWGSLKADNLLNDVDSNDNLYYSTWSSNPDCNQNWVEFDFQDSHVHIMSYEIKSAPGDVTSDQFRHPKSWKLIASNNHVDWIVLDQRSNCSTLKGKSLVGYFICQQQVNKSYQYVRFVQLEEWKNYNYEIDLSRFELYGTIF